MRIALRVAPGRERRWMRALCAGLGAAGHRLELAHGAARPLAGDVAALLALERVVVDRGRAAGADVVDLELPPAAPDPDLTLDFTDDAPTPGRAILATFDGVAGEDALIAALLAGGAPLARLVAESGDVVVEMRPALEAARSLSGAIEAVGSRLAMAILAFVADGRPRLLGEAARPTRAPRSVAAAGAATLARFAREAIARRLAFAPHWRIGWRFVSGGDLLDRLSLEGPRWTVLADTGDRFYADPFALEHAGRTFLYFEDYDHRVGRGAISVVEFGREGPLGPARLVIEEPHHLSYPHVFEHDGALWMIPESSAARDIALWRCVELPHRWERVATLVSGVEAADATVFRHAGRWWMTAVIRPDAGGYSDALAIWHAPAPEGPWTAHPANPVLIDTRWARPAGSVAARGGKLVRPVQDCETLYGAALGFAEITRLDPEGFAQRPLARLAPQAPLWPGTRLHTWTRAGALEAIDGDTVNPRFAPARALYARRRTPRGSEV